MGVESLDNFGGKLLVVYDMDVTESRTTPAKC